MLKLEWIKISSMVRLSVMQWISLSCLRLYWVCSFSISSIECHKPKFHWHQPQPLTWWDNHHHLSSTDNFLPCWFRILNRNHLFFPLHFQHHFELINAFWINNINTWCSSYPYQMLWIHWGIEINRNQLDGILRWDRWVYFLSFQ